MSYRARAHPTVLPPGPAAGRTLDPGPPHIMTLQHFLSYLSDPPVAAAALACVLCVFAIGKFWAAVLSAVIGAGLAWTAHPWLCAVVAAVAVAAWLSDCRRYPRRDCLWCKGAGGYKRGYLFWATSRPCRHCEGAGNVNRLGTRILTRASRALGGSA